ncbi:ATP phosphoribosyltransferase [Candidatus Marinamargulisbacteria bacterium SCGC AAA071-K20]|nr:ATP phosphoribosyltransferase [Candidatus Marinamargulisbacteria bacterium SCGC AAA071-K20]
MITIASAKGYLLKDTIALFATIGIHFDKDFPNSRKLSTIDKSGEYQLLQIRPWDVPAYVQNGAADFGVVGLDVLLEQESKLLRLADLKYGGCKLVVAGPKKQKPSSFTHNLTVATKYPQSTEAYFRAKGLSVNIIKLYGAIELAPATSLSDLIVDLTATGQSLKENKLHALDTLFSSTAYLVANPVSFKMYYDEICDLTKKINKKLKK